MRCGVVRRAEGPGRENGMTRISEPRDAVDRARRDGLLVVERREDRRERSRQHRLSGTGRTDEEQVVPSCRRDLERTLRCLLPRDIRKVDLMPRLPSSRRYGARRHADAPVEVVDDVA